MSRSAVVEVVTGVALLAGFAVVANMYKHGLAVQKWWVVAIVLGLGAYGALVTATSVRRLVDPKLETPWSVLIIAFVFTLMAAFGRAQKRNDEGDTNYPVDRKESDPSEGPMGVGWAVLATMLGLAMYGGGVGLAWAFTSHPRFAGAKTAEKTPAPSPTPTPAPPTTPTARTPTPVPARELDILDAASLGAAIDFARPHFTDNRKAPNRGAELLARYAAAKVAWKDVVIAKNETSPALVEKDPPKEWGKRLCVAGTLGQIEKTTFAGVDGYVAVLDTKTKDELQLFVVGDTGTLVKRKPARFCGVVTGRIDVDGRPATFAVGMLSKR